MITDNFIGNNRSSEGNKLFKTFNPVSNEMNPWEFVEATEAEVERAMVLASDAFLSYSKLDGKTKATFLRTIAKEIENLGDLLLNTYMAESGLPRGRAEGERTRTLFQLHSFADMLEEGSWVEATIDTALPLRQPVPKVDIRKCLMPIGPIVVFGSSNFPLAYSTAGGDTASALAAGCPVVVKSHPMHAGTGALVASAVIKSIELLGLPNGVFSNLNSSSIEIGKQLAIHPGVKGIGFTGSVKGGRTLYNLAAQRKEPIPVFAEMGSINPVVLFPEELKRQGDSWALTYADSMLLGVGQFCTNPGLFIAVKGKELDNFSQLLKKTLETNKAGTMLHPQIHANFTKGKEFMLQNVGVVPLVNISEGLLPQQAGQALLAVSGETFLKNPLLHHEVFGPFSIIVECNDNDQMLEVLANLEGQLTGTIIATQQELQNHMNIVQVLQQKVGRLIFNGVPTGVEVCPSMMHGGPYPASSDARFTAVGIHSVMRWVRPVSYQDWPD